MKASLKFPLILLSVFLVQCRTTHHIPSERKQFKEVYISQFKNIYFRKLLAVGFNNSKGIKAAIKFDNSGFSEPILSEYDYLLIDSLVTLDNNSMKTDSANSVGRVAEGAEGKYVLNYILDQIESKQLHK